MGTGDGAGVEDGVIPSRKRRELATPTNWTPRTRGRGGGGGQKSTSHQGHGQERDQLEQEEQSLNSVEGEGARGRERGRVGIGLSIHLVGAELCPPKFCVPPKTHILEP